ncbi:MAG: PadR family transcriptional regulator [Candidatus Heimdallarchaeota archaeon]|nr:PadR family transcriptional regulator [Candidatus Heimdallarchaeota archaeon]MBY8994516.1 PadR family transcriptional regulator [Candidatus Heimdallarchaeota archaeon]
MERKHPHRPMSPFRPHMPFGPKLVKELSRLVFLWTISEESEGITGYELQKNYQAKQTTVYRVLKGMEDKELLTSEETIVKGRAQRLYKITDKGNEHLVELREKWTTRIAFLTEITPFGKHPPPIFRRRSRIHDYLNKVETKEEMLEFLDEYKNHINRRKTQLESRIKHYEENLVKLDEISKKVSEKETFDQEDKEQLVQEYFK